uniref:Uncharacterized protein n=1 Tax=Timema douglasi TaxID=61478 RepID=A0A7R8Z8N8_TIMDO|nr:unnamed protein product [Timema douglasi]
MQFKVWQPWRYVGTNQAVRGEAGPAGMRGEWEVRQFSDIATYSSPTKSLSSTRAQLNSA